MISILHTCACFILAIVPFCVVADLVAALFSRLARRIPATKGQIDRDRRRCRADLSGMNIGEAIEVQPYELPEKFRVRGRKLVPARMNDPIAGPWPVSDHEVPTAASTFDDDDLEVS